MPDTSQTLKRFYKSASAFEAENGWSVQLDTRPLKTPAKAALTLPTQALAEAVAEEWEGQGEVVDIPSMHLTRLANVAVDRTPLAREAMADELARYCETDLVCHLAEGPAALREQQEATWAPARAWAGKSVGVVLLPVEGIVAAMQPPASLAAARDHALGLDDFRLTGLTYGCGLLGSAVLALAVSEGEMAAADAFEASRVDEAFQQEQWGVDEEAAAATAARRIEADAFGRWVAAL